MRLMPSRVKRRVQIKKNRAMPPVVEKLAEKEVKSIKKKVVAKKPAIKKTKVVKKKKPVVSKKGTKKDDKTIKA